MTETEFRLGFGRLVRMIAKHLGKPVKKLTQTWTRNMITNDVETAEIASQSSSDFKVSNRTLLINHPWVEDVEEELKQLEEDKKRRLEYEQKAFGSYDFKQGGE